MYYVGRVIETNQSLRIASNPDGTIYSLDGYWVPSICIKQFEVYNDYHRYLLVTGPRKSAKTIAVINKIVRHAWENDRAMVAIVTKTIKNAKTGVWEDLIKFVLPQWINANIGLRYTQEPKVTGDARLNLLRITNAQGTESEIQLHSVDYCQEIVAKFKGSRFSLIFFSEIDNFDDRVIFDIGTDQLRSFTVPYKELQFIGDCNPPESGTRNWQHDLWFKEKDRDDHPDPEFQNQLHRIEFKLDDNPFIDEREKKDLKAKYRYRKATYNRFINGQWEDDSTEGHFSDVFNETVHILGDVGKGERILPSEGCLEQAPGSGTLLTGWDPGEVNHAMVILEKIETAGKDDQVVTKFAVLDELQVLNRRIGLRAFAEGAIELIDKWEKYCLDNYKRKPRWRHFSDSSAFRFKSAAESTDELLVREISQGRINLAAAPKYRNSVRDRVKLVHQLLFEQRLFFSGQCQNVLTSIRMLKKGDSAVEYVLINEHKHAFDALSYALISEAPIDLVLLNDLKVGRVKPRHIISV